MNNLTIGISFIDIGRHCNNCYLEFRLFMIILLVFYKHICNCIHISKNIFLPSTSIRKSRNRLETNLVYFVYLAQFHSKKATSQSPCFDIEYWKSYGPFLSNKLQWSKIQNIHCNFFNFQ